MRAPRARATRGQTRGDDVGAPFVARARDIASVGECGTRARARTRVSSRDETKRREKGTNDGWNVACFALHGCLNPHNKLFLPTIPSDSVYSVAV